MSPRGQEPLLAQRPPSETSDEERIEEEDALLTGRRTNKAEDERGVAEQLKNRWREIGLFIWALAATAAVVVLAVVYQHALGAGSGHGSGGESHSARPSGKRNLIFMVSDGMGPTSLETTRTWRQFTEQLPYDETLVLDEHLIGQSRTRSSSSLVTDSAAGATAFSCGQKTYNGAISILPDFTPCGSVMEAAKRMGYTTGLVVTTRITDATPAVFASHVRRREMEDEIAMQMIGEHHPLGRMVDLMLGGGRCHFLPNSSSDGCRADAIDVTEVAKKHGWSYISTRHQFDNLGADQKLPLMGLFAHDDIPYEIDRRYREDTYPSLAETAQTALEILETATKDSEQGFFIMIEGSRIDHAGHANDPAAQVHEVLAYDKTMAAVLDFIENTETPTLMVATSDHETGGLAAARQLHATYPDYLWYPGVLANASHSAGHVAHLYHEHLRSLEETGVDTESEDEKAWLASLASKSLGVHDMSQPELNALIASPDIAAYTFADMVSRRAQMGWSTHGHSGADVNIYTSDPVTAKKLRGNHENTEVGEFLRWYLDAEEEVERVDRQLREEMIMKGASWLGETPRTGERLDGQDHLDHYNGDHKRGVCEACVH